MQVKEINNDIDEYGSSELKLEISGDKITCHLVNSLRKVCLNQIPMYALHTSKIKIIKNSSVYDNTEITNRFSQLPIMNINHQVNFLPLKYYINGLTNEKHPEDTYDIEYFLKVQNNGFEKVLNVTTNDLIININNKKVDNSLIYSNKYPITLIQLRIGEEIECSMKAILSIGEFDSIFNSSNSYYEEIEPNKFYFTIESSGQFTEYELLLKGCEIIITKLKIISENINLNQYNTLITENNSAIIDLINEDYICGGIINDLIQNMKETLYCGITKQNFMQKNILLKIKTDNTTNPIEVFKKGIIESIKICEELKDNIKKCRIGKKKN